MQTLPRQLPEEDIIAAEAVRSVFRRGFYDKPVPVAGQATLMGQFLRLVEEVGEYHFLRIGKSPRDEQAKEVADIAIVAYQIAWLTGIPLSALVRQPMAATNYTCEVGELARALRKWSGVGSDALDLKIAIQRVVSLSYVTCEQLGYRLDEVVSGKLAADEQRGYQHQGVQ